MYRNGLGAALDDEAIAIAEWNVSTVAPSQADVYAQLHQLAAQIYSFQQIVNYQLKQVSNADGVVDWALMATATNQVAAMRAQFTTLRRQIDASNVAVTGWLDGFDANVTEWVQEVQDALAGAIAFIPNTIAQALGNVLNATGHALGGPLLWLGVGAVALLLFTQKAERTRTYKRFVA